MTILLQIDSSARTPRSHTRRLTRSFVDQWLEQEPESQVIYRDVATDPPPPMTEQWIASAFTPEADRSPDQTAALKTSDVYIDEVEQADVIVMGAPMYNYGMPAALKAWFDQVIRVNRTFHFDPDDDTWPISPILAAKTLVIVSSRGEFGFEPGGIREHWNHLETHIRTLQHFLGVEDSYLVAADYQEFGDERHARSMALAEDKLHSLVKELAARFRFAEEPSSNQMSVVM